MPTFNLVDEPWVPVRTASGTLTTLSLRDTLREAATLRRVEDASPLVLASLHRFLLAVLHRALEGPTASEDVAPWFTHGFPVRRIDAYLQTWRDRFDLFHPKQPFFQVPGLDKIDGPQHWTILLPEEGSHNTTLLFNARERAGYEPAPATPAEAGRALLTYQTFALGSLIRGAFQTSGAEGPVATAALVLVTGRTLLETLCLNLVPYKVGPRQLAIWERDGVLTVSHMAKRPAQRVAGPIEAYTWPVRSVLLIPEHRNGAIVVPTVIRDTGIRPETNVASWPDPMVAYRYREDGDQLRAVRFHRDRAFWRDFDALLPRRTAGRDVAPGVVRHAYALYHRLHGRRGHWPQTMAFGLSSTRAKIECWRTEVFDLPPAVLKDRDASDIVKEVLRAAEEAASCLYRAASTLANNLLTRGDRRPAKEDRHRLVRSFPALPYYWSTLGRDFAALLASLASDPDPDHTLSRWYAVLYRTLREAWTQTTCVAGDDAKALRAVARADPIVGAYLVELRGKSAAVHGVA